MLISLRGAALGLLLVMSTAGCGARTDAGSGSHLDAGSIIDGSVDDGSVDDADDPIFDASAPDVIPCVGLECQRVSCSEGKTTLSGRVYDPSGKYPVYNVAVFVPNAPLEPMQHGASCDTCGKPLSGKPIVATLTNATGNFRLDDVPVGPDIPLVMQIGKWRRKVVVPNVAACVDTAISNKDLTRLPKNQTEGDLPLIAITPAGEPLDEVLLDLGIDPSEFTNGSGKGSVRFFSTPFSNLGPPGQTSFLDLIDDLSALMKYDILVNACDGITWSRGPLELANMGKYLDAGGRLYAEHFQISRFSDPSAPADLRSASNWNTWGDHAAPPYRVDLSFPKGKAMADWMKNAFPSSTYGEMPLPVQGHYVDTNLGPTKSGLSQRWVYPTSTPTNPSYITITTPTTLPPGQRCGRSLLADLHDAVSSGFGTLQDQTTLPGAFKFLFFQLAACVQDDSLPPVPPPTN